jgi:hypothetical protein
MAAEPDLVPPRYALLGRLPFLHDEWLRRLQQEAAELRPPSEGAVRHFASPGRIARKVVVHRGLWQALRRALGHEAAPPFQAGYLYYDRPGAGIEPHVDVPEFAINVLLMISREPDQADGSATVLYPPDQPPVRVVLAPGEAVALEADRLVHSREPMHDGERVTLLTMGFRRGQSPRTA